MIAPAAAWRVARAPLIVVVIGARLRGRRRRCSVVARRRGAIARDRLLRLYLVVGLEHRTTSARELGRVLLQAGDDAVDVWNLAAAQAPDIRGAGHLLFHGAAI